MDRDFSLILDDCLQRLREGQSLEECLKHYPKQAELLRPLLLAAVSLQATPKIQPRPEAFQAGRQHMLAAARQQSTTNQVSRFRWKLAFQLAIGLFAVIFLGGFFGVNASARSLPGDLLYVVKLHWEAVRLELTSSALSRHTLESRFAQERFDEIQKLVQSGRQGVVEIDGVLEAVQGSTWTVDSLKVMIQPTTMIKGSILIGSRLTMSVDVHSDGQTYALTASFYPIITTSEDEFEENQTSFPTGGSKASVTPEPNQPIEPVDEEELELTEEPESTDQLAPSRSPESTEELKLTVEPEPTHGLNPIYIP